MAQYYFFRSIKNGSEEKLRALEGQTFPDGTPVLTHYNVQAPKDKGQFKGGNRSDYPLGTYFASTHLEVNKTMKTPFYTVFPNSSITPDVEFHPVSEDPNFPFIKAEHCDKKMNMAFAIFMSNQRNNDLFASNKTASDMKETKKTRKKTGPADENGTARSESAEWKESYQDQIETESRIICTWIKRLFRSRNISLINKPNLSKSLDIMKSIYACGENLETITSESRFERFLSENNHTWDEFACSGTGPEILYVEWIFQEHIKNLKCTATPLDPDNKNEMVNATNILSDAYNEMTGDTNRLQENDIPKITEAFKNGWTLEQMTLPENMNKSKNIYDYAEGLFSGKIELPSILQTAGASYIDIMMADKKNEKPSGKEGFHIDESVWRLMIYNFHRRVNTLLTGPTGSGKTELIIRMCKKLGVPYTIIQMGACEDAVSSLVGKMDISSENGTAKTVFDWAPFALAIQKPGVVILDEVNRIPKNGSNVLFGCLADTRILDASDAKCTDIRQIKVHPDCAFFATANIGAQYTGTGQIDEALASRFEMMELNYMNNEDEVRILQTRTGVDQASASNIVFIAQQLRDLAANDELEHYISTRQTLRIAQMVKDGFDIKEALEMTLLPRFSKGNSTSTTEDTSSERSAVKSIIASRFNNVA